MLTASFLSIGANHWLHKYNVRTYLMFGVTLLYVSTASDN